MSVAFVRCVRKDCLQWKPRSEFRPDKRKRNGLKSWCVVCYRKYQREKQKLRPPRTDEARLKDNAQHRRRWAEDAAYRQMRSAQLRQYYELNKERCLQWSREWYLRNRNNPAFLEWRKQYEKETAANRYARHKERKLKRIIDLGVVDKIYCISDGEAVKIGWTQITPEDRRSELQIGSHRRLAVVGWWPGNKDDEAAIHQRFAHLHIRGEWFRAEPELLEFVESKNEGNFIR